MSVPVTPYQAYVKGYLSAIYRDGDIPAYRSSAMKSAFERGATSGRVTLGILTKGMNRPQRIMPIQSDNE